MFLGVFVGFNQPLTAYFKNLQIPGVEVFSLDQNNLQNLKESKPPGPKNPINHYAWPGAPTTCSGQSQGDVGVSRRGGLKDGLFFSVEVFGL